MNFLRNNPPSTWKQIKLGEICTIISGQSPPGSTYRKTPEGLPFFQGKAEFGEKYPIPRVWCVEPRKVALPNDILISVRAPVGPTNVADQKCCIGRGLAAIRPGTECDREFLLAFLRLIEPEFSKIGSGSTFSAINRNHLEGLIIPLPPLDEQKRIVAKLQEQMSAVEKIRSALEDQGKHIEQLPKAILRDAFSGKL